MKSSKQALGLLMGHKNKGCWRLIEMTTQNYTTHVTNSPFSYTPVYGVSWWLKKTLISEKAISLWCICRKAWKQLLRKSKSKKSSASINGDKCSGSSKSTGIFLFLSRKYATSTVSCSCQVGSAALTQYRCKNIFLEGEKCTGIRTAFEDLKAFDF